MKKKRIVAWVAFGFLPLGLGAAQVKVPAEKVEIVVAKDAPPSVTFAAEEMATFLSQAFGREVGRVEKPTPGRYPIRLGAAFWTDKSVDPAALPADGFAQAIAADGVTVAGLDDPREKADPRQKIAHPAWGAHKFDHGTLNGAYDFLERYAGVRFYFPGDLGTCVPSLKELVLETGVTTRSPDLTVRSWLYHSDGAWIDGVKRKCDPQKTLNSFRLRASTHDLGVCHGLNAFKYPERFGKTHPEYFALDAKGERHIFGKGFRYRHLCLTSGIRDEIVKDCLSYLRGEPASVRGIPGRKKGTFAWGVNVSKRYIDLMPQDGSPICHCENCQKLVRKDGRKNPATELVWSMVRYVAEALKKEGFSPTLTMMSYSDYHDVPDFDVPDNARVMAAFRGPWSALKPEVAADNIEHLALWERKTGHRLWIWTYPGRQSCNGLELKGVPSWAPNAWGAYYAKLAPHVFGIFAESETTRCIDNLMGYYLLSKIGWDRSTDVKATMDEFYARMFGKGAGPMRQALETMENKFIRDIANGYVMTDVGPKSTRPSDVRLWTEIYSAAEMDGMKALYDAAAAAVPADSPEARRIALFRTWMYDVPREEGDAFRANNGVKAVLARHAAMSPSSNRVSSKWNLSKHGANDAEVTVSGKGSLRLRTREGEHWAFVFGSAKLRPSTRYRLSYAVKTDNLAPTSRGGGVSVSLSVRTKDGKKRKWQFPKKRNCLSGTTDWVCQSHEFDTEDDLDGEQKAGLILTLANASGTAWFDDVWIEEIEVK